MQKRFVLAVDIAEKVLRPLRKAAYRRQIHDLAHRAVYRREFLGKERQVFLVHTTYPQKILIMRLPICTEFTRGEHMCKAFYYITYYITKGLIFQPPCRSAPVIYQENNDSPLEVIR